VTKYVLTKPHFLDNSIKDVGEEVELPDDARPSLGMEGIDAEGRAKCEQRDKENREKIEKAVASGQLSRTLAENVIPKAEKLPVDVGEDGHGQGRRRR
jgi:hypothetical protein